MTLDFSSRYSEIFAPATVPPLVNFISRYLPKRLELSLMTVQAFPKASTRLLTSRIFSWSVRLLAWIKTLFQLVTGKSIQRKQSLLRREMMHDFLPCASLLLFLLQLLILPLINHPRSELNRAFFIPEDGQSALMVHVRYLNFLVFTVDFTGCLSHMSCLWNIVLDFL